MALFSTQAYSSSEELTRDVGLLDLIPGCVVDSKIFDPCGYSLNAIVKVHVWKSRIAHDGCRVEYRRMGFFNCEYLLITNCEFFVCNIFANINVHVCYNAVRGQHPQLLNSYFDQACPKCNH